MNLKDRIQLINDLIRANPDLTIRDYIEILNEINNIEMKELNFTSAIIRMPFGEHKGKLLWSIGHSYFNWLEQQNISKATLLTLEDARKLYDNQGAFAVMKRSRTDRYLTRLETIMQSERQAKARVDDNNPHWIYFTYPIQDRPEPTRKDEEPPKESGYFPSLPDFDYKPKY